MTIILAGTIGRSGLGGQAWASLQYLLGLRALGHDVYYLEDCGRSSWVYVWEKEDWTHELDYPAAYVNACLAPFGFGDRWIYRDNYRSVGISLPGFLEICARADLLLLRAVPFWNWREEYERPRRRAFIDVDPGFTQISIANGDAGLTAGIGACERRFTYAQRFGLAGCEVPPNGGPWIPTRPPVFLDEWPVASQPATHFTTVVRWQGFKEVTFNGVRYGQRDREFPPYFDLPTRTSQPFKIAQMGMKPGTLEPYGWEVLPGEVISRTPESYREFIQSSRGEFSIPKNGYVAMRGGWFSDRSVCYLASGRPVLIEDTGLADWLPLGDGLISFFDPKGALDGLEKVNADYPNQCRAARTLAEDHFASGKVLPRFLEAAMD
jgi:hypothetical protein